MTRRGWVLFVSMGVIWGVPYLLIRIAVAAITPASLVFGRTVIASLVLLPLALARNQLRPLLGSVPLLLAYTFVEIALPWFLLSHAETRLSSSLTGLMIALVPIIGAGLSLVYQPQDRLDIRRVVGLVLGVAGVGALVGFEVSARDLLAVGEIVLVAICYAVGPIMIALRLAHLPRLGVVAASLALTAIAYAPVGVVQLNGHMPGLDVIAAVVLLGVVCSAAAFVIFFALIEEVGAARSTVITYVNPAVAVLLGVVLLHERFDLGTVLGFALILAGCYLATSRHVAAAREPAAATVAKT
jgi:drug/metabolite transporter (DMT)-like permease